MTDEEKAKDYAITRTYPKFETSRIANFVLREVEGAYLAGLKAGKDMNVPIKWHKVADGDLPKGENIHRDIYLKDRYGNLYTGNYFPKDKCHAEDCFAVEFLDWGFQGSQFCKKEQISEWCEIPKYEEESNK